MAANYDKYFASARRFAVQDGIPDDIVESRIGRFESLFEANQRIAQQLEEVGLLASACNRVVLAAKFDAIEVEQRLKRITELSYQQKTDGKLCLMNIGLLD